MILNLPHMTRSLTMLLVKTITKAIGGIGVAVTKVATVAFLMIAVQIVMIRAMTAVRLVTVALVIVVMIAHQEVHLTGRKSYVRFIKL